MEIKSQMNRKLACVPGSCVYYRRVSSDGHGKGRCFTYARRLSRFDTIFLWAKRAKGEL